MTNLKLLENSDIEYIINEFIKDVGLDINEDIIEADKVYKEKLIDDINYQLKGRKIKYNNDVEKEEVKQSIINYLVNNYKKSIVKSGKNVGVITSQSFGEANTQSALRTFYFAGVSGAQGQISASNRIQQIVQLVKEPEFTSNTIFFNRQMRLKSIIDYKNKYLVYSLFENFVQSYNIEKEDEFEEPSWFSFYKIIYTKQLKIPSLILIMKINIKKLLMYDIKLWELRDIIVKKGFEVEVICSPESEGEIILFSNVKFDRDIKFREYIRIELIQKIKKIKIKGIKEFSEVFINDPILLTYDRRNKPPPPLYFDETNKRFVINKDRLNIDVLIGSMKNFGIDINKNGIINPDIMVNFDGKNDSFPKIIFQVTNASKLILIRNYKNTLRLYNKNDSASSAKEVKFGRRKNPKHYIEQYAVLKNEKYVPLPSANKPPLKTIIRQYDNLQLIMIKTSISQDMFLSYIDSNTEAEIIIQYDLTQHIDDMINNRNKKKIIVISEKSIYDYDATEILRKIRRENIVYDMIRFGDIVEPLKSPNQYVFKSKLDILKYDIKISKLLTFLKEKDPEVVYQNGIFKFSKKIPGFENLLIYTYSRFNFYSLSTKGSNLKELMKLKSIDYKFTTSNHVYDIYNNYGIEALRSFIYLELRKNSQGLNFHHSLLISDLIGYLGVPLPLKREGLALRPVGPFAKASNEMALKQFTDAALSNETDKVKGLSSRIIIGKLALIGPKLPLLEEIEDANNIITIIPKQLELNYEKINSIDSL